MFPIGNKRTRSDAIGQQVRLASASFELDQDPDTYDMALPGNRVVAFLSVGTITKEQDPWPFRRSSESSKTSARLGPN
jgi:hypothetical protein